MKAAKTSEVASAPIKPDDQQLIKDAVGLVALYQGVEIKTDDDAQKAVDIIKQVKDKFASVEARRKLITKPMDDAKKSVMALFKPATDSCEKIETILKLKVSNYLEAKKEAARVEEARLADIAAKEKAKLEAKAEKLREQGKEDQANALEEKAATAVFIAPAATAKIEGFSSSEKWSFEVSNMNEFLQLVIAGEIPADVISVNQGQLDKIAKQWKGAKQFKGLKYKKEFTSRSY